MQRIGIYGGTFNPPHIGHIRGAKYALDALKMEKMMLIDEIYEKLLTYVENGGKLLMTAAHLNYSSRRDGEKNYLSNEKLDKLFGCRFTGESVNSNGGIKFWDESLAGILYPGTKNKTCDPIYAAGYVSYQKCNRCTCGFTIKYTRTLFNQNS